MEYGLLSDGSLESAEDQKDDLKSELVALNAAMRRLDPNLDFSKIIDPLLADQGSAFALVPKLRKQLQRMQKIRDGLTPTPSVQSPALVTPSVPAPEYIGPPNRDRPAQSRQTGNKRDMHVSGILVPDNHKRKRARRVPKKIDVPEVLPALGPLKRYANVEEEHYRESVKVAQWCYDRMLDQAGGPKCLPMRQVQHLDPAPPVERDKIRGFFTNRLLQWENIRSAALAKDFSLIQVGYHKNELLAVARASQNGGRQRFIAWAVKELQKSPQGTILKEDLLEAWSILPQETTQSITKVPAARYFNYIDGVKLTMEELQRLAFPHRGHNPRAASGFTLVYSV